MTLEASATAACTGDSSSPCSRRSVWPPRRRSLGLRARSGLRSRRRPGSARSPHPSRAPPLRARPARARVPQRRRRPPIGDDLASRDRLDDVRPATAAAGHQRSAEAACAPTGPAQGDPPREDRGLGRSRTRSAAGGRRSRSSPLRRARASRIAFCSSAGSPSSSSSLGDAAFLAMSARGDPRAELALHDERAGAQQLAVAPGGELAAARPHVPAVRARAAACTSGRGTSRSAAAEGGRARATRCTRGGRGRARRCSSWRRARPTRRGAAASRPARPGRGRAARHEPRSRASSCPRSQPGRPPRGGTGTSRPGRSPVSR